MSSSWDVGGTDVAAGPPRRAPQPHTGGFSPADEPLPTAAGAAAAAAERRHARRSGAERGAAAAPTGRAAPGDPGADPPAPPARGRSRSPPPPRWHWRPRSPPGRCWPPTAGATGTARYRSALRTSARRGSPPRHPPARRLPSSWP